MAAYDPEYFSRRKNTIDGRTTILVHRARERAKRKNIDCDLDIHWLRDRLEEIEHLCEVTGVPLEYDQDTSPWQPSLDRKDSNGGYTRDNVQVVCHIYNNAKHTFAHQEVLQLAEALIKKWA
jgi:hypothetical protein